MKNNITYTFLISLILMMVSAPFINAQRSKNIITLKRDKPVIELGESNTIHWSVKKIKKYG